MQFKRILIGFIVISNFQVCFSESSSHLDCARKNDQNNCNDILVDKEQARCRGSNCEGIRPDQRADLSVLDIRTKPKFPRPGEETIVHVDVVSSSRTETHMVPELYDFSLNSRRGQIAKYTIKLQADIPKTLTFKWTPKESGIIGLTAIADPDYRYVDRSRGDNLKTISVVVAKKPPRDIDFAIERIDVINQPDRPIIPRVVVVNNGKYSSSAPLIVLNQGKEIASYLIGPLDPGSNDVIELDWPSNKALGVIKAIINPRYYKQEELANNNIKSHDPRHKVDVAVGHVSVYKQKRIKGSSDKVTVSFRITNIGQNPITEMISTRLSIYDIDTKYTLIDTPTLPVGRSVYISHTFQTSNSINFSIEANHNKVLLDENQANNLFEGSISNKANIVGEWVSIGPGKITSGLGAVGRLMTIATHPSNPAIIYVGSPTGSGGRDGGSGIWKSTDSGGTWQPIADSFPSLSIRTLAISPSNPDRVIAATNKSGVFGSTDAGQSWIQLTSANMKPIGNAGTGMIIDPIDENRLYLTSTNGVYRSVNGGVNWRLVLSQGIATSLVINPQNKLHLTAAITNNNQLAKTGLYETFDGGDNWSSSPLIGCPDDALPNLTTKRTTVRLTRSGNRLYAGYRVISLPPISCESYTVYRTKNIWCSGIGEQPNRMWEKAFTTTDSSLCSELWSGLYSDPANPDFVYLTGTRFRVSIDAGSSFTIQSGSQPHVDHHALAFDPVFPKIIYTVSDGGIFRSTNRGLGDTWEFIGEGITNFEFYDIADAATSRDLVIGGTQDNGTLKYQGDSFVWEKIRGGDGATVDIDRNNVNNMLSMGQYADSIRQSNDGGDNFNINVGLPLPPQSCFNLHYHFNSEDSTKLLASCPTASGDLWQYENNEWRVIFKPPSGKIIRSVVDKQTDIYYAGSQNGFVYAGVSGANFNLIFTHPNGSVEVTDIEVSPYDSRDVYLTFNGDRDGRVFRLRHNNTTPDTSNVTFQDITSNLPNGLLVRTITIDLRNSWSILIGTNKGVYRGRSLNGGESWFWESYNNGLPVAIDVNDLHSQAQTGIVRAATLGRGAYEVSTELPFGTIVAIEGYISFLRVHDVGTGFGPPNDFLDGEVITKLNSNPDLFFGFQLREDNHEASRKAMLDILRDAFRNNHRVRIEYNITGLHNNRIVRVMVLNRN